MNPDLTGILVITVIGLALIALSLLCRIGSPPRTDADRSRTPRPDATLGFRDPFR
ncbi:hypothetical protein BH11PSE6_BH11PSE6_06100 [soil metagenome]